MRGTGAFGGMNRTTAPTSLRTLAERKEISRKLPQRLSRSSDPIKKSKERPKNDETFHALKMQSALNVMSYKQRNRVKEDIAAIDSFNDFELLPIIKDAIGPQALAGQEEAVPTPIQRVAIPALLGQKARGRQKKTVMQDGLQSFLIAAETGSGKTLAYLLPVLDAIKRAEAAEEEEDIKKRASMEERKRRDPTFVEPPPLDDRIHPTSGRPRAIILLPTAELVTQVSSLIRSLSFKVKVRSDGISASVSPKVIRRRVFAESGIDILISTPHLLAAITASDPNVLSRVRHLVIDEADSLLDRSFSKEVTPIIQRSTPSLEQIIFCSATIPRSINRFFEQKYPNMTRLVTPNIHAIPRRVQLSVVDIEKEPYRGNRNIACADTIYQIGRSAHQPSPDAPAEFALKHIIVFVNERETATELAEYLQSKGIDAAALNRDTTEGRKAELLKAFTARPPHQRGPDEPPQPKEDAPKMELWSAKSAKRVLPNTKVLVTTDIASRGIDTLSVRHVILYDVPHSTIDFIHRLGRTGRMKMRGRGIVLVGREDRRDVVREVKEAMFRGQALI
jgi:ATP-dependent RNA helicase MRH4, mitochondrial